MNRYYLFIVMLFVYVGGAAQAPLAAFTWSFPQLSNEVHFIDQSQNQPTAWTWVFGDGSGSTLQNPVHLFAAPGQYSVCLTAQNASGSDQTCHTLTIANVNALAISLPAGTPVCNGSAVALAPVVSGGDPPYAFNWSSSAGLLSCNGCQNPAAVVTQTTMYMVTATDANGDTASAWAQYTVTGGAALQASMVHTNLDCLHTIDTAVLTIVNGQAPFAVNWGDVSSSVGGNMQTHYYAASGAYQVSITDSIGCFLSFQDSVRYNGISETLVQLQVPLCVDDSTGLLDVSAGNGLAPYLYEWNTGATGSVIATLGPGTYVVTITDATGCTASYSHVLAPAGGWNYYVALSGTDANCGNTGMVEAHVIGGSSPFSYHWSNGAQDDSLTQLPAGTYAVTVTDVLGCQVSGFQAINAMCNSHLSGYVFYDANANCSLDSGEAGIAGIVVVAGGTTTLFSYTDSTGYYDFALPAAGNWSLLAIESGNGCGHLTLCNNPAQVVTVPAVGAVLSGNNFAYDPGNYDIEVAAVATPANPGFIKEYSVGAYSKNGMPFLQQAMITFTYDSALVYQSSIPPAAHNAATHTLCWLQDSLPYFTSSILPPWWTTLHASFLVPQTMSPSALLQSSFAVSPTIGDCDTSNNFLVGLEPVTSSLDPNAKEVFPAGPLSTNDSVLQYTIHFQNTGTDSTHFVIIKDTLSTLLDPSSVRNIAASHSFSNFTISGNGVLTWTFNPLRLVDSLTDPVHSKGFVQFRVKRKMNVAQGSIDNRASIYFDYNAPVVTNTVSSVISTANGVQEATDTDLPVVQLFPNPAIDYCVFAVKDFKRSYSLTIFDITGQLVYERHGITASLFEYKRQRVAQGVYLYKIVDATGRAVTGRICFE